MSESKGQFNSNFGFIMASVGSAVGLGNIWGFPYKLGKSGGFAFLFFYLLLVFLVGAVIMLGEFTLGRKTGKAPIQAYGSIGSGYSILGIMAVASAFIIMGFYATLGGYCMKYFSANFVSIFTHDGIFKADSAKYFTDFVTNSGSTIIFMAIFMVLNVIIVMGGVAGGIEKFTTVAMPALFVMLVIVIIRSNTLPGATKGLEFMFSPDFSVFKGSGWIGTLATAGGQVFFSLSLGMAAMITYGSYLSKQESLVKNSIIVPICDTIVALMAGLAVMPAVFAMGMEPAGGPGLLFVTLQAVFNDMGTLGPIFGFLMYFLVFIAAITSSISLIESVASAYIDSKIAKGQSYNRKAIVAAISGLLLLENVPTCLNALGLPGGHLANIGKFCWLDFYDLLAEGIMMPLGSLILAIIVGYKLKAEWVESEVSLEGNSFAGKGFWMFCFKVTAPIGMALVLAGQLDAFFALGLFN